MILSNIKRQVERNWIGEYLFELPKDLQLAWWEIMFEYFTME